MKKLPDYREKQSILYIDRRSNKDLIAYGELCLAEGRLSDAMDFYQKANHIPGLEEIRNISEAAGDFMTYQHVLKALKQVSTDDDWNRIGQQAVEQKKYSFALHAFQKSNNAAKVEEVRNMILLEDKIKPS